MTAKDNLWENKAVNTAIGAFVNIFRSIPFIILIILLIPFTKILLGTILGASAALPALIIERHHFMQEWLKSHFAKLIKE